MKTKNLIRTTLAIFVATFVFVNFSSAQGHWRVGGNYNIGNAPDNVSASSPFGTMTAGTPLNIYAGGAQQMIILPNGSVGIGILNPQYKFQVVGESHFSYTTPYVDPHPGVPYDAKFGSTTNGIAVNGISVFNSRVGFLRIISFAC